MQTYFPLILTRRKVANRASKKISRALSSRIENLQRSSPIDKALQIKSEALSAINEYKQLVSVFGNIRNEYDKLRETKSS